MTQVDEQSPSEQSEYVAFWNDVLVPKFTRYRHVLVDGLTHHSAKVMPSLPVNDGDRVVDVGCGFGDTAIDLARRVGPDGTVLGVDCGQRFIELAREDAEAAGLGNIRFITADVETCPFEPEHDLCFSRFGTQFFQNPVAGLRNMRRSLKAGGRMAMIVWRTIDDNPWLGIPRDIVRRFLPPPGDDARTCGPGPFSMADPDTVTEQLRIAGYTEVEFERIDAPLIVGTSVDDAVGFQLAIGPAGEVYREAGDEAVRRDPEIRDALATELQRHETPEGIVMQSSSWKVTARNP